MSAGRPPGDGHVAEALILVGTGLDASGGFGRTLQLGALQPDGAGAHRRCFRTHQARGVRLDEQAPWQTDPCLEARLEAR